MGTEETAALLAGFGLFIIVFAILGYVLTSIFMMQLFKKAKVAAWKAWVPVVNVWAFLEIGGQKGWWSVVGVIGAFVGSIMMTIGGAGAAITTDTATINSTTSPVTSYNLTEEGLSIETTTTSTPTAQTAVFSGAALFGYLIMALAATLLYIFQCIAAYNIGLKLGWGGGMVVLYIFLSIIWLGVAGLGKAVYDDRKGQPSLANKVA